MKDKRDFKLLFYIGLIKTQSSSAQTKKTLQREHEQIQITEN